jgi:hypothetical protein
VYNPSSDTALSSILKVSFFQTLKSALERKCLEPRRGLLVHQATAGPCLSEASYMHILE